MPLQFIYGEYAASLSYSNGKKHALYFRRKWNVETSEDHKQFNVDMDQTDMTPTPKLPKLGYTNTVSNGQTVGQSGHYYRSYSR